MASALPSALPSVLDLAPVVPVVVIEDATDAVPLARALVAGGLTAIEVTLRTPAALDAIRAIAAEVPDAVVGAGTVVSPAGVADAVAAGARFLVSPGWTERLLDAMKASGVPFLPGVSTTSEVVALLELGVSEMKFFPAEAAGGVPYLTSLSGPLPGPLLPDRRHLPELGPLVPVAAQRGLRRRYVDAALRRPRGPRLGPGGVAGA